MSTLTGCLSTLWISAWCLTLPFNGNTRRCCSCKQAMIMRRSRQEDYYLVQALWSRSNNICCCSRIGAAFKIWAGAPGRSCQWTLCMPNAIHWWLITVIWLLLLLHSLHCSQIAVVMFLKAFRSQFNKEAKDDPFFSQLNLLLFLPRSLASFLLFVTII